MLRKALDEKDLDNVAGGEVITSDVYNAIAFTTIDECYSLKNVSYADAIKYKNELYTANSTLSEKAFDLLVKDEFQKKGWI